ncbi:MAG: nuclear transport factor 2 family protein, partial [Thermoanaerobaculia bacterium]
GVRRQRRRTPKCEVNAFLGESSQQLGLGSDFPASTSGSTASRAKGVCATKNPGKMFDDSYDFRLPFDVPLTAIPKPESLPSGGGEPGRALASLVKAIQENDFKTARLHLRTREVPGTPPPQSELKEFFDGLALNYPGSITVTGGLIKGDRATLEMKGTDREGKKLKGTFTMKKIAANWRVVEQYLYFDYSDE